MVNKVIAIVQARLGSIRFPSKVLKEIEGKTLIEILFHRLGQSKKIDNIILATTENTEDDKLAKLVEHLGYQVFRGNEKDVLDRYYHAAIKNQPTTIVRITGDCPIIDSNLVDNIISIYEKEDVDYVSNTNPPTFPDGQDIEVFSFQSLKIAHESTEDPFDREHVTPFIKTNNQFRRKNITNEIDFSNERWTVDEPEDFLVIENVIKYFEPNLEFSWEDVIDLLKSKPEYFMANRKIHRNEGSALGIGQKLYKRAKKVIPGGTMLLSKRPEMYLPGKWPSYFSKAKGCEVWDLEGNKYFDFSIMGIGTNILGYGRVEVDLEVSNVIKSGNLSTFNCSEEVLLAERLIQLHPWADMARLARTGGEANAISIRLSRAASGRDKVAFCGYHGWHDWYLAANLSKNDELDGHLLPGLEPRGVPRNLQGTAIPFKYNDIIGLKQIIKSNDIGVIKMEVSRNQTPENGFLEEVRKLATENNIILVFDECTSGFRETFGGLHKKYNVIPDVIVLGKTLGNGYAISAVLGIEEVMKYAEKTFISSTFWTERIGPTAALKTL